MIKNCIAETDLYSVFIDSNEKPNKDMEAFLEKLPSEVKRLMDFFGITSIEKKITINIHSDLEEFKQWYESNCSRSCSYLPSESSAGYE